MRRLKTLTLCLLAAGGLAAMGSIPGLAAENYGAEGYGNEGHEPTPEQTRYGHTTFSLIEAKQDPSNISFSVPLYVTMAVTKNAADAAVPSNYFIANTSKFSGVTPAGETPFDIAVVRMRFTKLEGSTYSTVAGPEVSGEGNILFQIGRVTMPALSEAGTRDVALRTENSQFLEDSSPGGCAASNWKKIPAEPGGDALNPANVLALDLLGKVAADPNLSDHAAAAQFRVQYTVSALDDKGEPLGRVYKGDDSVAAGLGEFTP